MSGTTKPGWLGPELIAPIVILLACTIAITRISPPTPEPADAPATAFSAERAMAHVEAITRAPHPVGSDAHDEVRRYLETQLRGLGLSPQVHRAPALIQMAGWLRGAETANLWARLEGSGGAEARTILLSTHYDSVPNSPGAGDNGAAIAAAIETLRALRAGPPLRNHVIFAFPDAEELGLLGAHATTRDLAILRQADLVLNFEGRGNAGPVAMFETSSGDSELIAGLAAAVPRPFASSLIAALAKLLPNDTDLTLYRRAGLAGMNFALADHLQHYHSATDTAAHLDRGSLQHHGTYALGLVRHFGNLDAAEGWAREQDSTYFDVVGLGLVHYRTGWGWLWTLVAVAALALAVRAARRRGELSWRGWLAGFSVALTLMILAPLVVQGLATAVLTELPQHLIWGANRWFGLGYLLAFVGVAALISRVGWRRLHETERHLGAVAIWVTVSAVLIIVAPAANSAFVWPALAALGERWLRDRRQLWRTRTPDEPRRRFHAWPEWLAAVAPLPYTLVGAALVYALFIMDGGATPILPFLFAGLLWPLWWPAWGDLPRRLRNWSPAVTLPAAALVTLLGVLGVSPSAENPHRSIIHYALDADTGRALWLSGPAEQDPWLAQFFRRGYSVDELPIFSVLREAIVHGEAPPLELAPPVVELRGERSINDGRALEVVIRSPRGAACVSVWEVTDGEPSAIRGTRIDGQAIPAVYRFSPETDAELGELFFGATRGGWRIYFCALGPEGLNLELLTHAEPGALRLRAVDESFGLPQIPGFAPTPRPPSSVPAMRSELTMVSVGVRL